MKRTAIAGMAALALSWAGTARAAATLAQKCQAAKLNAAAKYGACRLVAEKKAVLQAIAPDYSKCDAKYTTLWSKAESKFGDVCPTSGDQAAVQADVSDLASCLTGDLGGTPAVCSLTTVQGSLNTCNSNLTWYQGVYSSCESSLGNCNTNLSTCGNSLGACETSCDTDPLAACQANLATCQAQGGAQPPSQLLQTGQTMCWDGNGYVIACGGTGQDGNLQKGVALAYTDNGDGTITDNNTGLMWEKKIALDDTLDPTDLHDADNCYSWSGTCGPGGVACGTDADCGVNGPCQAADCQTASPNGLTIFEWVAQLNAANFAGHNDWRIPNVRELQSMLDYNASSPAVAPAFNGTNCGSTCTDLASPECSCTVTNYWWWANYYGSSSTQTSSPDNAWCIEFYNGTVTTCYKGNNNFHVRAVRGGS